MRIIILAAGFAAFGAVAHAGVVERACLASDKGAGNRALCGCIQHVANLTLTRSDQRMAAKFFSDPDKAEQMRMSSSDSSNAFWEKYKNFGATAAAYCSVAG
jgi:hypothetical protein